MSPLWLGLARDAVAVIGGSATLIAFAKWSWDQATGRNARKVRRIRDSIEATNSEGRAWMEYWQLRAWVVKTYGGDGLPDLPPQGEDDR